MDKASSKILKRKPISKSQRVICEYKDGSCDVSLMITDAREITSTIKYWIPHIKVVSPESIQSSIMKDIQKYIN
jgi:predicted DNA-binding transcriptional regulator YafY